jgi:hypothetical protein
MRRSIFIALFCINAAMAAEAPQPPCDGAGAPPYAAVGAKPNWAVYKTVTLQVACAPAMQGRFDLVGALAGSFREDGGAERILERLGALSKMTAIQYYSERKHGSAKMLDESTALRSQSVEQRRADFTPAELKTGNALYHAQSDPVTGNTVVYLMRISAASPREITVEQENVGPLKYGPLTVADPRGLRTVHLLRESADGVWRYYLLTAVAGRTASHYEDSIMNRALAMFRYVAGQPTERGEPLMHN